MAKITAIIILPINWDRPLIWDRFSSITLVMQATTTRFLRCRLMHWMQRHHTCMKKSLGGHTCSILGGGGGPRTWPLCRSSFLGLPPPTLCQRPSIGGLPAELVLESGVVVSATMRALSRLGVTICRHRSRGKTYMRYIKMLNYSEGTSHRAETLKRIS